MLKGRTQDTNSSYLAKQLHNRGYKLETIVVVPDDVTTISEKIKTLSNAFNVVLTTGGIGPTHDDVTYEALAQAFNRELYNNPLITKFCREFFKTDDESHPGMKLGRIPVGAKLTFGTNETTGERAIYPNVSVENVIVFPGVPHLCQRMFQFSISLFPKKGEFFSESVYSDQSENELVSGLNAAVERFPDVAFGSYPIFFHSYYSVRLDMESLNQQRLHEAQSFLINNITGVVNYDENWNRDKQTKIQSDDFLNKVFVSLTETVASAKPENVYLYMDGGKNSTLLLYILSTVYETLEMNVNVVHVEKNPRVSKYVEKFVKNFNVDFLKLGRTNLERFFQSNPDVLLMKGTLSADPQFSNIQEYFNKFRVENPLVDYKSRDIWRGIRLLFLPYCDLYDQGYSSLYGDVDPRLIVPGPLKNLVKYKSAFTLNCD